MPKKTVGINDNAALVMTDLTMSTVKLRQQLEKMRDITQKGTGAREISIALMKVEEAEMWLGRTVTSLIILKDNQDGRSVSNGTHKP